MENTIKRRALVVILGCLGVIPAVGSTVSDAVRVEGMWKEPLGPHSAKYLYDPGVGEVWLKAKYSSAVFSGDIYNLVPQNLDRQEVLEFSYKSGGTYVTDNRGQTVLKHHFTWPLFGGWRDAWWRAKVRTWKVRYEICADDVGALASIPAEIQSEYLADEYPFYPNDATVVAARDAALNGETHPLMMAHLLFDYIQSVLYYNNDGSWDDAPTVLNQGHGSCSEYAYAYVAVCRSAGIPARLCGAMVRRGDVDPPPGTDLPFVDDPHHRWAEIYLPNIGWIYCEVQGGTWGYLPDKYVITSQTSGESDLMGMRYDSQCSIVYTDKERIATWWPNPDSFYALSLPVEDMLWENQSTVRVNWTVTGEDTSGSLVIQLLKLGQVIWSASGVAVTQGYYNIPVSLVPGGPYYAVQVYRSDNVALAGYLEGIQIRSNSDGDHLADDWEIQYFGNLAQNDAGDPDGDNANNQCEYWGGTNPAVADVYASDYPEAETEAGFGVVRANASGVDGAGLVVNGVTFGKGYGAHADSLVAFQAPDFADTFRVLWGLEDRCGGRASFTCYHNGALVFNGPRMTKSTGALQAPGYLEFPVTPGDRVELKTYSFFNLSSDYTCWLQPAFSRTVRIAGDATWDEMVDIYDVSALSSVWLSNNCGACMGVDVSEDGSVDVEDLAQVAGAWLGVGVPPLRAGRPIPADGALYVDPAALLSWCESNRATVFRLYFGASEAAVAAATPGSPPDKGEFTEPGWNPGGLATGTWYYWRVDKTVDGVTTPGMVWRFHTWLEPGLVHWYKFDEGTGHLANDSAGDAPGCVDGGQATWTTGHVGSALLLDGVNDAVRLPFRINQTSSTPGATLCAWVYPSSTSSGRHEVISSDDGGWDWSIMREGGQWYVFTGGGMYTASGFTVGVNQWQFLAASFYPTGVRFFKNTTSTWISNIAMENGSNPLSIGDNPVDDWQEYFDGRVDGVRVYDRPLNTTQVQAIYAQGQ
ncbi:MAG: NPCBM/NEW2 domain-containing protein [Sedimentisphaerales bacterium]|nr:NPCBM/NEW2 domain-containing protein [Sedimentisphaerales bacterium]